MFIRHLYIFKHTTNLCNKTTLHYNCLLDYFLICNFLFSSFLFSFSILFLLLLFHYFFFFIYFYNFFYFYFFLFSDLNWDSIRQAYRIQHAVYRSNFGIYREKGITSFNVDMTLRNTLYLKF